ncbi:hypothetical protein P3S68_002954 [Capsicum galapagoense]
MERKKTAGRRKIPLVKIEKDANRYSTFSKRCSGLYKKASELVRENDVDLDFDDQIIAENSRNKVNQLNNRLNELDEREEIAKEKLLALNEMNKTREKNRWESIDQLNANEIIKFQTWLDVGEFMLKDQLPEASSSSQSPPEDANI